MTFVAAPLCRDYHQPPTSECPWCWEIMYPSPPVSRFFTTQPDDRLGGQGAIKVTEIATAPALDTTADARKSERGVRVVNGSGVRRLTPTECERLQSLPDDWTAPTGSEPDSRRYAALGDAVTASVGHWLGERIIRAGVAA